MPKGLKSSPIADIRNSVLAYLGLFSAFSMLGGCAGTPPITAIRDVPVISSHASGAQSRVVAFALSLTGLPYRSGGDTPAEGFDCSGFVHYVYSKHGLRLPRDSRSMAQALTPVPIPTRRPGDLIFFNTTGQAYSHVGIYIGDEQFVHAPSSRTGAVRVSNLGRLYWRNRLVGVRRPVTLFRSLSNR